MAAPPADFDPNKADNLEDVSSQESLADSGRRLFDIAANVSAD